MLAIDLFSGCGGLSEGLKKAGFNVAVGVELDEVAAQSYKLNHKGSVLIQEDIRKVTASQIKKILGNKEIHLLAGCPPCQGFSSIRRLNKKNAVTDPRNSLLKEYLRLVKSLRPLTFMMENVPGLKSYYRFESMVKQLKDVGYFVDYKVVNIAHYGVPQNRRRLVVIGSLLDEINVAEPTYKKKTVRETIGMLDSIETTSDPLHKIVANHTPRIMEMIKLIPKNGGSRKDLPEEYQLECHKKPNVGFNDIYGRLRWDDFSTTITGGCLNPSKGRFLHPIEDRVITPREASLLQTFPKTYKFPLNISKSDLALLIGNALPPEFSRIQSKHILKHIQEHSI